MSALLKATLLGLLVATLTAGGAGGGPQPPTTPPRPAGGVGATKPATAVDGRAVVRAPLDTIPDSAVSVNWAGFWITAFRRTKPSRGPFTRVSASWVQPEATCASLEPTFAAFWVGIGGVTVNSRKLEQIGSAA